jgi:hypothetical protein
MNSGKDDYTPAEAARRRDEVIRRMTNTPPQPKTTTPLSHQGKKKKAGVDHAADKDRDNREV